MDAPRVLVVEDDDTLRTTLAAALRDAGLAVDTLPDGSRLEHTLGAVRPAVVILDWMLPGRSGPDLVRVIRASGEVGVIMLTARDGVDDRLRGFAAGIDDYVPKPFAMAELVARVRALLHRLGVTPTTIQVADLVVDEAGGVARRADTDLGLTATEFRLLSYLAANRGRVLSGTQILSQVWGYENYSDNLVQAHMSALRRKMEERGPRLVHTVRGLGYVLRESP